MMSCTQSELQMGGKPIKTEPTTRKSTAYCIKTNI